MSEVVPEEIVNLAAQARDTIATYRDAEDLITIGAYKPGQNPRVDRAVKLIDKVTTFLKQRSGEKVSMEDTWKQLAAIFDEVET